MRIYIFGDSIVQGYFDVSGGGWVSRIAMKAMELTCEDFSEDWVEVFNLGVSGDAARGVADRIKPEIEARSIDDSKELIVISVGINDAVLRENIPFKDVYDFQEDYEHLLDTALGITPHVLCVGLTAVDESVTNPWKYSSTGKQYLNNRINLFEDTIKQSAINKDVPFVALHDEFLAQVSSDKLLLSDGLHPNDAGHEFVLAKVQSAIEKILG